MSRHPLPTKRGRTLAIGEGTQTRGPVRGPAREQAGGQPGSQPGGQPGSHTVGQAWSRCRSQPPQVLHKAGDGPH